MGGYLEAGPMSPWARMRENILIKQMQKYVLYEVSMMEAIPASNPILVNFGAIPANGSVVSQSLQTPLEMDGFELGQWRACILDDITVQVYQLQNTNRYIVKNARSRWTKFQQLIDPHCSYTELAVFQDQYPYVDVFNPGDYAYVGARIAFWGIRYRLIQKGVFPDIEQVPGTIPFTAVLGEGFTGVGFSRAGLS